MARVATEYSMFECVSRVEIDADYHAGMHTMQSIDALSHSQECGRNTHAVVRPRPP